MHPLRLFVSATFVLSSSFAMAGHLSDYNTQNLGVRNQGFQVQASSLARRQFSQNQKRCKKFLNHVQNPMNTYGVVVKREGQTIFKMRRHGTRNSDLFKLFSASKTISALMLGAYFYQNPDLSLETPVSSLIDHMGSNKEDRLSRRYRDDITFYDTISMGTGLDWCEYARCASIDTLRISYGRQNQKALDFVLSKKMGARPGSRYTYSAGNYLIMAEALRQYMGEQAYSQVYQKYLFAPLGITRSAVETDGQGLAFGGSGIWLSNDDFAKIGQLLVNKGVWKGRRIISESYIDQMLEVSEAIKNSGRRIREWEGPAGASLWTNKIVPGLPRALPGVTPSMVFSSGLYGQFMLMFPEHNMVVARTGGDKNHSAQWFDFAREASRCFGGPGVYDASQAEAPFPAKPPGNIWWEIDGGLKTLAARWPMNAYAQEMCSCLFTGNAIRKGIEKGVEYCKALRPLPDQLAERISLEVSVDPAKKQVKAFFSDDPELTFALAQSFGSQACKLVQRARPKHAARDGSWEARNGYSEGR